MIEKLSDISITIGYFESKLLTDKFIIFRLFFDDKKLIFFPIKEEKIYDDLFLNRNFSLAFMEDSIEKESQIKYINLNNKLIEFLTKQNINSINYIDIKKITISNLMMSIKSYTCDMEFYQPINFLEYQIIAFKFVFNKNNYIELKNILKKNCKNIIIEDNIGLTNRIMKYILVSIVLTFGWIGVVSIFLNNYKICTLSIFIIFFSIIILLLKKFKKPKIIKNKFK